MPRKTKEEQIQEIKDILTSETEKPRKIKKKETGAQEKPTETKIEQEEHTQNIQENKVHSEQAHEQTHEQKSGITTWILAIATILIIFNQIQIAEINALFVPAQTTTNTGATTHASAPATSGAAATISLEGDYEILAPALLAQGETPVLANYGTKIKKFPTISGQAKKEATGDAVQDAINSLVPTGMPFYGQEAGVTFDDPISAQKVWGNYERSIQLNEEQQQRWAKIVGSFTCDYCCGSPQRPTIITHCGCSHARAWRGMTKWLISKYGDKYSDQQILGELSRWKTLWYPGPTVQRVIAEQQATGGNTGTVGNLDNLPGMVGGC